MEHCHINEHTFAFTTDRHFDEEEGEVETSIKELPTQQSLEEIAKAFIIKVLVQMVTGP